MRNFRYLPVILLTLLALEIFYFFYVAPRLIIRKVVLKSDIVLSDQELLNVSGLDQGINYYLLKPDSLASDLEKKIAVSKVSVQKKWPSTVIVTLEGHSSCAGFLREDGTLLYLDSRGTIFTNLAANEAKPPLINGLEFIGTGEKATLVSSQLPLLEDLEYLKKHYYKLFSFIESIDIQKENDHNYYLNASFINLSNKAIWPFAIDQKRLYNSLIVLNLLEDLQLFTHDVIDFRTDEIVYHGSGKDTGGQNS